MEVGIPCRPVPLGGIRSFLDSSNPLQSLSMKTKFWSVLLFVFGLFTIVFSTTADAAVTVTRVWSDPDRAIAPKERVQLIPHQITVDAGRSVESVIYESVGVAPASSVFSSIEVRDGASGRIVGRITSNALSLSTTFRVDLERSVAMPEAPLFLFSEGRVAANIPANIVGKPIILIARAVISEGQTNFIDELAGVSPTFQVEKGSAPLGDLNLLMKFGQPSSIRAGESSFLGAFIAFADNTENLGVRANVGIHTTGGGSATDIGGLFAVVIQFNGQIYRTDLYQPETGEYYLSSFMPIPRGDVAVIAVFGTLGQSFSAGGSLAVSTTPERWRGYGLSSGRETAFTGKTVVGHTMQVLASQPYYGGKGNVIPAPTGDLK